MNGARTVREIKLYCGFCAHRGIYKKKTTGKKGRVSNTIHCEECNRDLNQGNTWK